MNTRITQRETPARLVAWLDCPNCGTLPKPGCSFTIPAEARAREEHLHLYFPCDRCGSTSARLHLVRRLVH